MKRSLLLFCALSVMLLPALALKAQVTTGAMSGLVADKAGKPMTGVRVMATHEPSGTKYGSITGSTGRYNIPGLRTGGPYTVQVSAVGMKTEKYSDIFVKLGETYVLNSKLDEGEVKLSEITVISQKGAVMSSERTGAATTINREVINSVPTISRNIIDFTKVTPQANGRSFGGQDNRMNNLTIDGSVFNNSFGLSGENNECGGIYQIARPKVNMCYPPLRWQTYDVDFTAAKYDAAGKKTSDATATIRHNGVVIHKDLVFPKATPGREGEANSPGAIFLQDHGNPVAFRNIWIVEK